MRLFRAPLELTTHFAAGLAIVSLGTSTAATLNWAGSGSASAPGDGTWDTITANQWTVGSGAGDTLWTQTGTTAPLNSAVFGGIDGTYAVSVGADIAASRISVLNSGYTLSATSARVIQLANSTSSTDLAFAVADGKTLTIGSNVTVRAAGTSFFGTTTGAGGGTININSGGILEQTAANTWAMTGTGTTNVNSGGILRDTVSGGGAFVIGANIGDNTTVVVNGGLLNLTGTSTQFILGSSGTGDCRGTLTLNSGTVSVNASTSRALQLGSSSGNSGTLNLNGGVLAVRAITTGTATATSTVNFNGGTLKPVSSASAATFMTGLTAANVKEGGAKIDTNNFNITIGQRLLHSGTSAIDGGLVKSGSGTLTLTGSSTFTGATTVSLGTLSLTTGSINSSTALSVAGGATLSLGNALSLNNAIKLDLVTNSNVILNFTGTETIQFLAINGAYVAAGTYNLTQLQGLTGGVNFSSSSGTPLLMVAVPEPTGVGASVAVTLGLLIWSRRRKARLSC